MARREERDTPTMEKLVRRTRPRLVAAARHIGAMPLALSFALALLATPAAAQSSQDRFAALARECATEIPWLYDVHKAKATAAKQSKPVLVYVRCVNSGKGYESAQRSIAAKEVPLHDDGYRKDLLFRACVLADRTVQALINDDFVPVCMTYHFETHGRGKGNVHWSSAPGMVGGDGFVIDPDVGAVAKGSLRLGHAGAFMQSLVRPAIGKGKYRVTATVKTHELDGQANVRVLWTEEGTREQKIGESTAVTEDGDWVRTTFEFELSAKPISILVLPTLGGSGTAWFDDLELREVKEGKTVGPNLLRNGDVDPKAGGSDPLIELGLKATATITPALLVVRDGRVVRKLHRIGAMSPDYVERWLRSCLKVDKAAAKAKKDGGGLLEAQKSLRKGAWSDALRSLAALRTEEGSPEGQFWEGLCLHRLGRHAEARIRWTEAVGPTRWGRRSAACLLQRGPHPVLSLSERTWPAPDGSPSSEHPKSFDGRLALRILLELQDEDGSFGDHSGVVVGKKTSGPWKAAYTGIAIQAVTAWMGKDPERKAETEAAVDRARKFLVNWSRQKSRGLLGAFNHPYAIQALLQLGEKEAAQRLADKVLAEQAADGSWSVYGPNRPTSFNTAQSILAMVAAREAGLTVSQAAIDKACAALQRMRSDKELFPYSPILGHERLTTEFGSIARDPLCEHALLRAGKGDALKLAGALRRFLRFHHELRAPTKHYSGDFNSRFHGSYFFFFSLHSAIEAAAHVKDADLRARVVAGVQAAMLEAAEKDSSAIDHMMYGRAYGTAMALLILAPRK